MADKTKRFFLSGMLPSPAKGINKRWWISIGDDDRVKYHDTIYAAQALTFEQALQISDYLNRKMHCKLAVMVECGGSNHLTEHQRKLLRID